MITDELPGAESNLGHADSHLQSSIAIRWIEPSDIIVVCPFWINPIGFDGMNDRHISDVSITIIDSGNHIDDKLLSNTMYSINNVIM
jgi:hypothetical protein